MIHNADNVVRRNSKMMKCARDKVRKEGKGRFEKKSRSNEREREREFKVEMKNRER